jgi:hypothetical protein
MGLAVMRIGDKCQGILAGDEDDDAQESLRNRLWQGRAGKVQRDRLSSPLIPKRQKRPTEPEGANYPEIMGRLSVKVQEQREAQADLTLSK